MRQRSSVATMLFTVLAGGMLLAGPALGDPGLDIASESALDTARGAIEDGNYRKAVKSLEKHVRDKRRDADALNLLGFSLRKLGRYDEAEERYLEALEIEPRHLGANEYLGELYLRTDRPELARERLAVLERACPDTCAERRHLDQALTDYGNGGGP